MPAQAVNKRAIARGKTEKLVSANRLCGTISKGQNQVGILNISDTERFALMREGLAEFKRLADELDLDYWIDGGTLLGQHRNNAIIPWDDDIDIGMLRSDFEKLRLGITEKKVRLTENYVAHFSNSEVPLITNTDALKIRDIRTRGIEYGVPDKLVNQFLPYSGLAVDVVPYDAAPRKKALLFESALTLAHALRKKGLVSVIGFRFWRFSLRLTLDPILRLMHRYSKHLADDLLIWPTTFGSYPRHTHRVDDIYPVKRVEFLGLEVLVPRKAELYLEILYGNGFMELPPELERKGHFRTLELIK